MDTPSQLYGQIRLGRVSSVDAKRHTAQVKFSEQDGFTSGDLPVLVTRPGDFSLPAAGTPVLCLIIDGTRGVGYVLGAIYTDSDAAPLDDASKRSMASDDLRLGDPNATDKVSLAPKCKKNFDDLQKHFAAIEAVLTGAPISEAGNAAPSSLQKALAAAINSNSYPTPADPAAEKVSAK